jgi:hypothetical protein
MLSTIKIKVEKKCLIRTEFIVWISEFVRS